MNLNFKVALVILLISAIVLTVVSYFIIDRSLKSTFFSLGISLFAAGIVEILLFFINPEWFKNKAEKI